MADQPTDAPPIRKRGRGADPDATRRALVDAAFVTLREDGFRGATARGIADRVPCNQATIYYHFGGIPPLLVEALSASSDRRLERYREVLSGLTDARAVVEALHSLHAEDVASGHFAVLSELVGGITAEPALRTGISEAIQRWLEFVADLLRRTLADTPLGPVAPFDDLADIIFSLFLGTEIRTKLDGDEARFTRVVNLGQIVLAMLPALAGPAPEPV